MMKSPSSYNKKEKCVFYDYLPVLVLFLVNDEWKDSRKTVEKGVWFVEEKFHFMAFSYHFILLIAYIL